MLKQGSHFTAPFEIVKILSILNVCLLGACSQPSVTSELPMPEPIEERASFRSQVKAPSESYLQEDFSTNSRMRELDSYQYMMDEKTKYGAYQRAKNLGIGHAARQCTALGTSNQQIRRCR